MTARHRSLLFVSGERPDRFDKAMASGADVVCIDLEDAVGPAAKDSAREAVVAFVLARAKAPGTVRLAIRINAVGTLHGLRDVLALAAGRAAPDTLLVPKVESPRDAVLLHEWLPDGFGSLVALIETPIGIERAAQIAAASRGGAPRLAALMLGGADLSMELGAAFSWDGLASARGRLVNAARSAGLQAWDVPFIDVADPDGLRHETRLALAMGFDCKSAIHPSQIAPVHEAFAPSPADLHWARSVMAVVASWEGAGDSAGAAPGAFLFEGRLVDAPLLKRAERILRMVD